ncbi:MAG: hypothetical protein MZV64_24135 [Ignavibacteriales bacterium]|nr:hypothetical protein [Ignavibacteriales bacterium]
MRTSTRIRFESKGRAETRPFDLCEGYADQFTDAVCQRSGGDADRDLTRAREPDAFARHQGDRRADDEQAHRADDQAEEDGLRSADEEIGDHREERAECKEEEGCERGFVCRAAEFFGVDAQFLAGERVEDVCRVCHHVSRHLSGAVFGQPFGLVDERQFLLLLFRAFRDLFRFDLDLMFVEFARTLHRQPFAQCHRTCAGKDTRQACDQNVGS